MRRGQRCSDIGVPGWISGLGGDGRPHESESENSAIFACGV